MKIEPIEEWVGTDKVISYVAIRSDESGRKGYVSTKPNISAVFPFIEDGIDHSGVLAILESAGIGLPGYYEWRTRSGCYFCFYQRKSEWVGLAEKHPDLWEKAVAIENKVNLDVGSSPSATYDEFAMKGRQYTWSGGESLPELFARKDEILQRHMQAKQRAHDSRKNLSIVEVMGRAFDEEDDAQQCSVCAL